MARDVGDARTESAAADPGPDSTGLAEVRAAILAAIKADPLSPDERARHMRKSLERCNALRERLLEEMGGPLPAGWGARMIREGRP